MKKAAKDTQKLSERQDSAPKFSLTRWQLAFAAVGVALGVAAATFIAFSQNTPEQLIAETPEYTQTIEAKQSESNAPIENGNASINNTSETVTVDKPQFKKCEEPTGLTEFQAWVKLEGCEFVIWEVTQTGDVRLVSGDKEYFQTMFDDSDIVTSKPYSPPAQKNPGTVSGGQGNGAAPRPTPEESYTPPPPPPVQQPVSTVCPWERSENPAVYDACRSGFVMPSIQPVGIVSCYPANAERTSWTVKYEFALVGGSYGNTVWTGVHESSGSRGYLTKTIDGLGEENLNGILPMGHANVEVSFDSMSPQYPGIIGKAQNFNAIQGDFSICN